MTTEPVTALMDMPPDPIDQLIALEEAFGEPVRAQYVEGAPLLPPQPDHQHNEAAFECCFQLRSAGSRHVGFGNGYRAGKKYERTQGLVIPDFYVLHRRPTELDEAYRRTHKGWYPIELLALAGEVTSTNHETDSGPKYRTYAAAGVPLYVLLHRRDGRAYAFSDPVGGTEGGSSEPSEAHYATRVEVELGRPLPLPGPYPALETAFLLDP